MTEVNPSELEVASGQIEPASRWRRSLAAFAYRDYRFLWMTSLFSSAARTVQQISLAWLTFDLTGSALLLGTVLFIYQFPSLFTAPVIGVLVDRLDRRRILIASQSVMALLAVAVAVDILLGYVEPWHLMVFAFVSGFESTIIHVVRQALIPRMVPPHVLMNAISLHTTGFTVTRIGAPFIGGLLIVTLGVGGNFLLQAVLLTGVAIAAFPMRIPPPDAETLRANQEPFIRALAEGLRYILGHSTLRTLFGVHFLVMFLSMPITNFLPVWAAVVFDMEADGLGLLYTTMGIGALIGTSVLVAAGNVRRKGRLLLVMAFGLGVGLLALGGSDWFLAAIVALGFIGMVQTVYFAVNATLVQSRIPDGLQGRVMSIYNLSHGMIALGTLALGVLAEMWDIQVVVMVMGIAVMGLVALAVVVLPGIRRL